MQAFTSAEKGWHRAESPRELPAPLCVFSTYKGAGSFLLETLGTGRVTTVVLSRRSAVSFENFTKLFNFCPKKAGNVGVERERFLALCSGVLVPRAAQVLADLDSAAFGHELSACQVESRVGPTTLENLARHLVAQDDVLGAVLARHRLIALATEVGPYTMPLDVYPDPTGRYQEITRDMPRHILRAACRIAGTHVHIGMPNYKTALAVYNHVCKFCDELSSLGDGSSGERLLLYKQMVPYYKPTPYRSWEAYYETACRQGFVEDPRKCWTLIRISKHGTIEFRMFGATNSTTRICSWAQRCHELCQEALATA